MSGSHHVLHDNSRLSLCDRVLFRFESTLTLAGGIIILVLILLSTVNVLGRWLFDWPISGYVDWTEQAMAFIAFLGLAYTQREGGHIRMDFAVSRLHGRRLWFTELFSTVLMLVMTLILIYGSYLHFLRAYQLGDSSLDIQLPTWPAKLVVPVAFTVLALRLLLQCWAYSKAAVQSQQMPVALPLIVDVSVQAVAQAELVMGDDIDSPKESQQ